MMTDSDTGMFEDYLTGQCEKDTKLLVGLQRKRKIKWKTR